MFTNVTFLYFLLLVPLSGFIAWLGDRIGHKTGKRRHTVFGLRPRHTAMVFTVGTGMCISLVSFALMWLFSETFRIVVRDGVRLYATNRALKHSNITLVEGKVVLQREVAAGKSQADRALSYARKAILDEDHAVAQRNVAVQQRDASLAQKQQAVVEVQRAQVSLGEETTALRNARLDLNRTRLDLTSLQGDLHAKSLSLNTAERRVGVSEREVADATQRVHDARRQVRDAEGHVAEVRRVDSALLTEQERQQRNTLADLHTRLEAQTQLINEKTIAQQKKLAELNSAVEKGQEDLLRIQTSTTALREKDITYRVGEEIDRVAIKPGYNIWRIEAILDSFMTTAARKAETRRAQKDKDAERAIVILPKIVTDDINGAKIGVGGTHTATERETLSAAAASIRKSNTDVVILIVATANAVAGEPVAVDLKLYNNPVVFSAAARIGDAKIDGNGSPQEIADKFYSFLHQDVRKTLLHAGIIPTSLGGDTADGVSAMVNLSGEEWLRIMDRIRLAGSNARVVVTAAHDLRAGDPVDLHFDVKGVTNSALRLPW